MKALLQLATHAVASEGLDVARPRGNQEEQEWGKFTEVQYITSSFILASSNAEIMGVSIPGQCCNWSLGSRQIKLQPTKRTQSVCKLFVHSPVLWHGEITNHG